MQNKLTFKVFIAICVSELLDSSAQVIMKKGLLLARADLFDLGGILGFLFQNSASCWVWLGISLYILNFFIWMIILSQLDLSTAVPLTSLNYILLPLLSLIFLNDKISGLRWAGIAFIITGIYFVSQNKLSGTEGPCPE